MTLSKNTWYGIIVATIVAAALITTYHARVAQKAEKEQAMVYQLSQLREAVQLYLTTHKALPKELKEALVVSRDGKAVTMQWGFEKDTSGNPVDPFGTPYAFNGKNGWVSSRSQGYESW